MCQWSVVQTNIDVNRQERLTYIINPGTDWRQVPETHPSILFGAGSIVSTQTDMARFIQALFDLNWFSKRASIA